MTAAARAIGSPLLSLSVLESLATGSGGPSNGIGLALHGCVSSGSIVHMREILGIDLTPNLDAMKFSQLQRVNATYFAGDLIFSHDIYVYFDAAATAEDNATARILDRDCWYHHPHLVQLIAQQFMNGTRQSHFSDKLLAKMGIQPTRLQGFLPLALLTVQNKSAKIQVNKLHLTVTDAQARDWNMFVEFDGRNGQLIEAGADPSQYFHSLDSFDSLANVVLLSDGSPRVQGLKMKRADAPKGSPWSDFQIRLSSKQQQAIFHLKQAAELTRSHWIDSTEPEETTQHLAVKPTPLSPPFSAFATIAMSVPSDQIPSCFKSVQEAFSSPFYDDQRLDWQDTMMEWRAHVFETIVLQSMPLMDFSRWGMQRYANMHPESARRHFQTCLIDAAMQANRMQQLPKVLVDIIVDYHYVDVLPYISNEEQETLIAGSSSK